MNTMVEQLWFIEDQFNTFEDVKLKMPKNKKIKKPNPIQDWADNLGNQVGEFNINLKRRMIEDQMGEAVMPIFPHFIGTPEELVLQEIYAHLGE
jgi:hypothetical protein